MTLSGSRPRARVVLLAGASGSGKTRLARRLGLPSMALDDFYRDGDDPWTVSRFPDGVDWDDPDSWDGDAAVSALAQLCSSGEVDVPRYDIPSSRRVGTDRLALLGSPVVVAEGIFAAALVEPLAGQALLADALCLRRNRSATFVRRLARDLVEGRKSVPTLVTRGVRLARTEPDLLAQWTAAGCRPVTRDEAEAALRGMARGRLPPRAMLAPGVDHLAALQRAADSFVAGLKAAGLTRPVPGCPGWTVADLADHLAGVHRWARAAVLTGVRPAVDTGTAPQDPDGLRAWVRRSADDLIEALSGADATDPAWTLAPPRTAAFWLRRQAHETALHCWDLWHALGETYRIQADLAADGVDEVLATMWPRQLRLGRAVPPDRAVAFRATDRPRSWVLAGRDGGPAEPGAVLHGTSAALVLLLWGRIGPDDERVRIEGDDGVARAALARAVTP